MDSFGRFNYPDLHPHIALIGVIYLCHSVMRRRVHGHHQAPPLTKDHSDFCPQSNPIHFNRTHRRILQLRGHVPLLLHSGISTTSTDSVTPTVHVPLPHSVLLWWASAPVGESVAPIKKSSRAEILLRAVPGPWTSVQGNNAWDWQQSESTDWPRVRECQNRLPLPSRCPLEWRLMFVIEFRHLQNVFGLRMNCSRRSVIKCH